MANETIPAVKDRVRQLIDGELPSTHEFVNYLIPQAKDIEVKYNQYLGRLQELEKEVEQIKVTLLGLRGQLVKTVEDIKIWDLRDSNSASNGNKQ